MSMQYIRKTYGVPAKRGGIIRYTNGQGNKYTCIIRSSCSGAHLHCELIGGGMKFILHPTWNIEYLDPPMAGAQS